MHKFMQLLGTFSFGGDLAKTESHSVVLSLLYSPQGFVSYNIYGYCPLLIMRENK